MVAALRAQGYHVIGPTVRDDAIVLAELESADALPRGWGVNSGPGHYRLRRRGDNAAFAHSSGPQSFKAYLHPVRQRLFTAKRDGDEGFSVDEGEDLAPRYAFLGVRGCDLRAIGIQDRVLGGVHGAYARRREGLFVVAVDCTEPGGTCFCASAGSGPGATAGFDLALTELIAEDGSVRYLARSGSEAGERLLAQMPSETAEEAVVTEAREAVEAAAGRMGRALVEGDLSGLLAGSLDSGRWEEIAQRCLTCGNCTMVCPTCFCTTVEDTTDLSGNVAERWLRWDSCFDLDYSYLHGGAVRMSARSRYRQWLTHKLGTWHDQFGESGCVGCGRCITWCPVGIDVTEELAALRDAPVPTEEHP
jgi:sulfhydrogenase subunit beta (sulfur reductase)